MSTAAIEPTPQEEQDQVVLLVNVADITPSPYQNRKIDLKSPKLQDLARSVGRLGVLQPVTVRKRSHGRPVDARGHTQYELIFGERRWRATKKAGHKTIPALVRDMSDEDALLAVVVENNQREDLTPLESAAGVQALLDAGYDVPAIAGKLGHDPSWVYRLAQLTKLTQGWKEAASEVFSEENHRTHGAQINTWSIGHLEEVARLPVETQERLLKIVQDEEETA